MFMSFLIKIFFVVAFANIAHASNNKLIKYVCQGDDIDSSTAVVEYSLKSKTGKIQLTMGQNEMTLKIIHVEQVGAPPSTRLYTSQAIWEDDIRMGFTVGNSFVANRPRKGSVFYYAASSREILGRDENVNFECLPQ